VPLADSKSLATTSETLSPTIACVRSFATPGAGPDQIVMPASVETWVIRLGDGTWRTSGVVSSPPSGTGASRWRPREKSSFALVASGARVTVSVPPVSVKLAHAKLTV
jgi:hypothetical protein